MTVVACLAPGIVLPSDASIIALSITRGAVHGRRFGPECGPDDSLSNGSIRDMEGTTPEFSNNATIGIIFCTINHELWA